MANSVLNEVGQRPPEQTIWDLYEEEKRKRDNSAESKLTSAAAGLGAKYGLSEIGSALAGPEVATPVMTSVGGTPVAAAPGFASSLAAAAPYAGVAAGTYLLGKGANDLVKGKEDNSSTGKASRAQLGWTSGGLSEVARFFGLGGGKNEDQQSRDKVRGGLKERGFLDPNNNLVLADGSLFDIGKDGGEPRYNVDFGNAQSGNAVGWSNPLAAIVTGGDKKLTNDFAGYFANGAMSNAKDDASVMKNARAMYERAGFKDANSAYAAVDDLAKRGVISAEDQAAYRYGIATVFGVAKGGAQAKSGGGNSGNSGGGKNSSGSPRPKNPKSPAPPISAPLPPPTTDQSIADAYRKVFEENQGVTGRNPLLNNPLLAIPSPRNFK